MKTLVTFTFNLIKDFEMFSGKTFHETHLIGITDIPEQWAKKNMPNYFTGRFELVGIEYDQPNTETAMSNQLEDFIKARIENLYKDNEMAHAALKHCDINAAVNTCDRIKRNSASIQELEMLLSVYNAQLKAD